MQPDRGAALLCVYILHWCYKDATIDHSQGTPNIGMHMATWDL